MQYLWLIIPALIVLFLAVILIRALRFKPRAGEKPPVEAADIDGEKAVRDLQEMIRCRTESYVDLTKINEAEFEKFRALLPRLYPLLHERCSLERIGRTGLVYLLKGKSSEKPSVLMAHYDVVPVNAEGWDRPAFDAIIEDGVLWGRGTLDTKGTLCGVLEAAETLLKDGFVPENDMYFAFAGDEETTGDSQQAIVAAFVERGIKPAFVLDEGGAIVENVFPGVKNPCALIGIAEKGLMDVKFTIEGAGGHASAPPPHTGVGRLSQAAVNIEKHPFPRKLTKSTRELFDELGRRSSFLYRLIFANLWCFLPLLDMICKKKGGELNAMMRTTVAFTMMEGSKASNVLPPRAMMGANLRIISGETVEGTIERLRGLVPDEGVRIDLVQGMNPSRVSETSGEVWETLKSAIGQTWPEALISPYLMIACSDSRHYSPISEHVYRFSAMALSSEERGYIHAHNERIPVDKIVTTARFYLRLLRKL